MGVMAEARDYREQQREIVLELKAVTAPREPTDDDIALQRATHEIMRQQRQLRYE